MKLRRVFLIALALSSLVIVGMILYAKEAVQDMVRFTENTDFYSATQIFAYSKLHKYTKTTELNSKAIHLSHGNRAMSSSKLSLFFPNWRSRDL